MQSRGPCVNPRRFRGSSGPFPNEPGLRDWFGLETSGPRVATDQSSVASQKRSYRGLDREVRFGWCTGACTRSASGTEPDDFSLATGTGRARFVSSAASRIGTGGIVPFVPLGQEVTRVENGLSMKRLLDFSGHFRTMPWPVVEDPANGTLGLNLELRETSGANGYHALRRAFEMPTLGRRLHSESDPLSIPGNPQYRPNVELGTTL